MHRVTNWIGDDGFLMRSKCQIRRRNPDGHAMYIDGSVIPNFGAGMKLIEIQQRATTHRGEVSAFGTSVAELPSRPGA